MSNVCPECDGERVVVEGTGQQADFAPCPKCAVGVEEKRVFSPEAHGVLDYNTLPKAEACSECGEAQGYHKLGCTKCVHTNKNGLFGLECIGCGLLLDGPQYGKKIEVPDVVVEQGPNTNGDIFPDRAQRLRDLADLSFRPAYVMSRPDPKSLRAGLWYFMGLEPEFFGKLTPERMAASAEHSRKVMAAWLTPGAVMARIGFGRWIGWDADGSPTEEWP